MKTLFKKLITISIPLLFLLFISVNTIAQAESGMSLSDRVDNQSRIMQSSSGLGDFSLGYVISFVIRAALSLLGVIFIVIMVFAGYRWMTASGNEEAIKKSQESIKRAIIGLIIVVLAYAITAFVFGQLPFAGFGAPGPMGST